ncbi:hypothetical protein ETAA8_66360 [Anatilimnocola aggregata]|uniref:Uncharacterized protein n=1 Tax=Anatilimnocola aggregata TaxID=2528021 RepID=A0A517YMM6_9BACT|nr:DUF433 domain-containing protein [Anatilimnocola aggregata]QDU31478.1 hypothetical protein ETAA8_66360 [Anatilimnocola aggregata]
MSLLACIKIDPAICNGKPSVCHYSVEWLLSLLRAGHTHEEILAHYGDLWIDDLLAVEAYPAAAEYQGSITLRELVQQALPCFRETMDFGFPAEFIYETLHASGPLNHHLTMRHGRFFCYVEPRTSPLSPDSRVFGQYMTLSWHSHDGFFRLSNYISRDELTYEVGGPAGICNSYTDCLAVFENGQLLPYRTHYTDLHGVRKVLDKRHEEHVPEDSEWFIELYRDVEIEWLE